MGATAATHRELAPVNGAETELPSVGRRHPTCAQPGGEPSVTGLVVRVVGDQLAMAVGGPSVCMACPCSFSLPVRGCFEEDRDRSRSTRSVGGGRLRAPAM